METIDLFIDTGKANTKGIMLYNGKIYKSMMPTKIEEVAGKTIMENDTVVQYDGESYLVGYGELNNNVISNQTKLIEEHKICAYTMIAKLFELANIEQDKHKINLTINIPIIEFIKHEEKTKYHEFFASDPFVTIALNGNIHNFEIVNIDGRFESSGFIYRNYEDYINKNVLVLDIGGKNTTFCMFNNLKPQKDVCGSLVYGGNVLLNRIRIKLQEITGYDFNITRIENIVMGNDTTTITEQEKTEVDAIIKEQIEMTLKAIQGQGIALNRIEVVFTGGTSKIYEPYLQDFGNYLNHYKVSNIPLYDNVAGWVERARQ